MTSIAQPTASAQQKVHYSSFSVCPKCAFIDKKQTAQVWHNSSVIERQNQIILQVMCPDHGQSEILLCSDPSFFKRCFKFSPTRLNPKLTSFLSKRDGLPLDPLQAGLNKSQSGSMISGIVNFFKKKPSTSSPSSSPVKETPSLSMSSPPTLTSLDDPSSSSLSVEFDKIFLPKPISSWSHEANLIHDIEDILKTGAGCHGCGEFMNFGAALPNASKKPVINNNNNPKTSTPTKNTPSLPPQTNAKDLLMNFPLEIEISIFNPTTNTLDPLPVIAAKFLRVKSVFQHISFMNFFIKIKGTLLDNKTLLQFNKILKQILENVEKENPLLVELTPDRLQFLARLEDSVFLENRVYPSIECYIEKDKEKTNLEELENSFLGLSTIANLQIVVKLIVSRPFPNLKEILAYLRSLKGFVKMIIIETERTTEEIMQQMEMEMENQTQNKNFVFSTDPLELINQICEDSASKSKIDPSDFFSLSAGALLEPFFDWLLNKGKYFIRPSPFCGFGTILLNIPEDSDEKSEEILNPENQKYEIDSVPLSRFMDIEKLFENMIPLIEKHQESIFTNYISSSNTEDPSSDSHNMPKNSGNIDFKLSDWQALKRSILGAANLDKIDAFYQQKSEKLDFSSKVKKGDIWNYFLSLFASPSFNPNLLPKKQKMIKILRKSQFLVVHNKMDVGCIDALRRVRCSLCKFEGRISNDEFQSPVFQGPCTDPF